MRLGLSAEEQRQIAAAFDARQEEARQQWLRYFIQQGKPDEARELAISAEELARVALPVRGGHTAAAAV